MKLSTLKNGFSLIELIMVMILAGILLAVAIPNLNIDGFRQIGGFQQGTAMIRFGQKLAITTGCQVDVLLNTTDCNLTFNGCTNSAIPSPGGSGNNFCTSSDPGVSPAVNFTFDNIGAPIAIPPPVPIVSSQQTINFGGGQTVTVEANTGFVYE